MVIFFDIDVVGFGKQAARNGEPLHFVPFFVCLLGTLQRHDVGVLRGRIVQPVQCIADVLSVAVACALLATELFEGFQMNVSATIALPIFPIPAIHLHTMKRHEKPDLPILHPLSDAVARALLDAGHQSGIVDDTVEDLPPYERVQAGQGGGRVGVLRRGSRAIVAHRASERRRGV